MKQSKKGIYIAITVVLLSFKISKEHAENALFKENALIIYYDLVLGLKDLLRVYGAFVMSAPISFVPTQMFFSKEWITSVSSISSIFNKKSSVEKLYLMYGDLVEKYFNLGDQAILESFLSDQSDFMDVLRDEYKKVLLDTKKKIEGC